jgi:hypothetical protein
MKVTHNKLEPEAEIKIHPFSQSDLLQYFTYVKSNLMEKKGKKHDKGTGRHHNILIRHDRDLYPRAQPIHSTRTRGLESQTGY